MKDTNAEEKIKKEQNTVSVMIRIYCKGNHKEAWKEYKRQKGKTCETDFLCPDCKDLENYAALRNQKCPYLAKGTKTFCSCCKTHCYKQEYREKIRKVMRYSGPRLILIMPGKFWSHLFLTIKKILK